MGVLRRFDAWAALRLFHPPIIRFCQWTGYTQHRLHRDMWFAAALYISWRSAREGDPWWWVALLLVFCLLMGLRAVLEPPDAPEDGSYWFRAFMWAALALSVPAVVVLADPLRLADNLWLLTAEYAATIANIPPREKKVRRKLGKRVTANL